MYYETFDSIGALESTTYYDYNDRGNPRYVMTERENPIGGEKRFTGTRLGYALNKQAVTYAIGEAWDDLTSCFAPTGYEMLYAYEYRYDGARARYLKRSLDPAELLLGNFVSLEDTWTDYDGDISYGDFTFDAQGQLTYDRWYEPGIAMGSDVTDPAATAYYHTDLIGTTRDVSVAGASTGPATYTAFGEQVSGTAHRYGYVGAHGYQTDDTGAFPYQHVGARYYDPTTGRFLQRDPIGIRGGSNVYAYAWNSPVGHIDPSGNYVIQGGIGATVIIPEGPSGVGAAATIEVCIYIDGEGNFRLALTFGVGVGFGGYAGAGVLGGGYSGTVDNMSGSSLEVGIDTPAVSGSAVVGSDNEGAQGSGFGPAIGAGARATMNYTCATKPRKLPPPFFLPPIGPIFAP